MAERREKEERKRLMNSQNLSQKVVNLQQLDLIQS